MYIYIYIYIIHKHINDNHDNNNNLSANIVPGFLLVASAAPVLRRSPLAKTILRHLFSEVAVV